MRVLVSPSLDLSVDIAAAVVAGSLAGADGEVVSLCEVGVRNLARTLSQAEVSLLRGALRAKRRSAPDGEVCEAVVGYVCEGVAVAGAASGGAAQVQPTGGRPDRTGVVAVTDHLNLTWRSPLVGRNDDGVGPRFPSMTDIYSPELVMERVGAEGGIIVRPGVVVGVGDHESLNTYESETARAGDHSAVSSELTPVAIVAAHMGMRIAAAVITTAGR